ncbi:TPA: hypothetical protein UL927_004048 [Stenotrophomonas maltophilia]|uniref:Uncharacterized protein n=3 Tax=Lysobacteraceae TaxID=32033 RepID=A0AAI9G6I9_STEMA|nr:hypothetical protein [Stenotrophomonas maltophilia]MBB1134944.1 hypothetical protein [Stenotrophomonas sp. I18B00994]EKZ1929037.1 hypothetical protein [Stenotrophomonas maltophilia]ELE7124707.1 hypothetical protein [Stenotrophomonas maltophilia]EMB2747828.1 hypothetical protein [Stenotrophomonas maltophilia]
MPAPEGPARLSCFPRSLTMALRLFRYQPSLLAAALLAPLAATAAGVPAPPQATPGLPAAPVAKGTAWTDRVHIQSGPDTASKRLHAPDVALRIVTPDDSESLTPKGLALLFSGNEPDYFRRNTLPGSIVESQASPATTLMPNVARALVGGYFSYAPDALPNQSSTLRFSADTWALVHQGNTRKDPLYRLNHVSTIEQRRADGTLAEIIRCSDSDDRATLGEWQANDYARLKIAAQVITMKCTEQLIKRIPAMYPRPLAAEDLTAYAGGAVPPARVRIYASLGRTTTLYTDAACREDYRDRIDVKYNNAGDKGVLGIPATETLRSKENERFSMLSYQEYEVAGGKPLIVEARFDASSRMYCDGQLSGQFVARPGQDYEVEMEVADKMCRLHLRQVHADGSTTPQVARKTPSTCEGTRAPVRIEPRQDMQVLLFSPGQLQIQDARQGSAPERLTDDAGSTEALRKMLQQASSNPGTRLCVVVPATDYSSALHDAVRERVLDAPQVLPSLWEEAATVNSRRSAAADAPVDIAAAIAHCNAFPIREFAPR